MTINAEQAIRRQHVLVIVLGLAAVKILARNRSILALGVAALVGAASRRAAADIAAWRQDKPPRGKSD